MDGLNWFKNVSVVLEVLLFGIVLFVESCKDYIV